MPHLVLLVFKNCLISLHLILGKDQVNLLNAHNNVPSIKILPLVAIFSLMNRKPEYKLQL